MPDSRLSREQLVALNACPGLSRQAICSLASDPDPILAPPPPWRRLRSDRPPHRPAHHPCKRKTLERARTAISHPSALASEELSRASRLDFHILTLADPDYPEVLLDLDLPPPVLYLEGRIPARPAIAIVGSRRADPAGLEVARFFGRELARAGATVVSGLARGVDTAAHRGALEALAGRTVGVLGCGLDVPYPRGRGRLVRAMVLHGAVVSEFPLGTPPLPHHFPIRNRIIAALALGTLVVQAASRSGSLITARLSLELGRDVYAVPGRIFDRRAAGTNALIRDGALLVQRPRDILESLPLEARDRLVGSPEAELPPAGAKGLPEGPAGALLRLMEAGSPRTPDELSSLAGLDVESILGALLELELAGLVKRYPGPAFSPSIFPEPGFGQPGEP